MISDLDERSKSFYIPNQVKFWLQDTPLDLSITCLQTKNFYYLVNTLMDKANVYIKKKSLLC